MRRYILLVVLALVGLLAVTPLALAEPLSETELAGVFPQYPGDDKDITRGEFAALLVKAAGISPAAGLPEGAPADVDRQAWYAPALLTLWQQGIIRGYPDGTLGAEGTLTNLEAAVMTARALGLPDGVKAAATDAALDEDSWGFVPCSWLVRQGIVEADDVTPDKVMQVGGAIKFLAGVFGSDAEAEAIMSRAQQADFGAKGISFAGEMNMNITMRDDMAGLPPELKQLNIKAEMTNEIVMPATLHQKMKMEMPALPGVTDGMPAAVEMEQYLVDGQMYQKIVDPQSGEALWQRLPAELVPDMEEIIQMTREMGLSQQAIPEELKRYFHYQMQGTAEVNGHKVYKIGYYGRIDDFGEFLNTVMNLAMPQGIPGMADGQQLQEGMDMLSDIIRYISLWGTYYIGMDDSRTYGGQFQVIIDFNEEIAGETMPIDTMTMEITVNEYRYLEDLVIELPEEAKNAEVLSLEFETEELQLQ
ncbi:MAG: hypothetical protein GX039_05065 [Clostridia bacterium]|nr:hypothetical protein [Clostridia bacterium]